MRSASPPTPPAERSRKTVTAQRSFEYGRGLAKNTPSSGPTTMPHASHLGLDALSFAGHETFPLRYTWLPKAVAAVSIDGQVFAHEDAMTRFGVGKNMVRAMRHWSLTAGVLEEDPGVHSNRGRVLRVTDLGKRLFGKKGWDPYLEDPATLWLLHWQIASTPDRATTWFYAFSMMAQPELTKIDLVRCLVALSDRRGLSRVSEASLRRDVDCFFGTYVAGRTNRTTPIEDTLDCPLVELGLINELPGRGSYSIVRASHPSLPDAVFAFALLRFLESAGANKAVPLESLAFGPGSPGRVFCLDEDGLLTRLERMERVTGGAITFDETAGLRQVLIRESVDPLDVLGAYYSSARQARRGVA